VKKYIIFVIVTGFFIFFQSTSFYEGLNVKGVNPDFLLITISIAAFILGPMPGQIIGFLTGIICDILAGGLLGISAFTYTVIGYGVGIVGLKLYGRSILISTILLFIATLVKAVLLTILAAFFLRPGYFGYFSHGRIFLEAVLNCLITPPLFFIVTKIKEKVAD